MAKAEGLEKLKILIVDDQPDMRSIVRGMLSDLGITQVFEESDGREATSFTDAAMDMIDVVICDWNMPRMSGATFYKQIQNTHCDIPFIMVTGRNDHESVMLAKDSGIYAYLLKPVSLEELDAKSTVLPVTTRRI